MKRVLAILLTVVFVTAAISGCNTGTVNNNAGTTTVSSETENSAEEASVATKITKDKKEESAESTGESLGIEEKDTPLYIFTMNSKESMPLYFINGSEIPHVDIEDFAGFMSFIIGVNAAPVSDDTKSYSVTAKADGDIVTLTREDGYYMNIDFANDCFHFEDYDQFMRVGEESVLDLAINTNLKSKDGKEEYLHRSAETDVRMGNEIDIDLSKYDIDLVRDGEKYYVPLQTVSDIFITPRNFNILYNGENLYVSSVSGIGNVKNGFSDLGESYYSVESTGKISEELAKFSYNEFCLLFDQLYGLKETHAIDNFDTLAKNTGAKEILLGTDAREIDRIYYNIIYRFLDDQHSKFMNPSYISGADAAKDFGEYLGEGKARNSTGVLMASLDDAKAKYYPEGIPGYEEIGDTAYITFDSFIHGPYDYYTEAPGADAEDTIGLISYSVSQILRENSPVKKVVLDLSSNTGGADTAAAYTIAAFLGEGEISLENPNTGARITQAFNADTNLDHEFDDRDTLDGKGLKLFCLTSPVSFSCGNLVPNVFKNSGKVTIIGKQSGGGSCGALGVTTAGGTMMRISGSNRLSFVKNGSFYDIDQGAPVDYPINDYDHFYDRKSLNKFLDSLY